MRLLLDCDAETTFLMIKDGVERTSCSQKWAGQQFPLELVIGFNLLFVLLPVTVITLK
jgi:hypothetical protein